MNISTLKVKDQGLSTLLLPSHIGLDYTVAIRRDVLRRFTAQIRPLLFPHKPIIFTVGILYCHVQAWCFDSILASQWHDDMVDLMGTTSGSSLSIEMARALEQQQTTAQWAQNVIVLQWMYKSASLPEATSLKSQQVVFEDSNASLLLNPRGYLLHRHHYQ
jgi:hypothetical protein